MIDLIIPYYNNLKGLFRTLDSINTKIFDITIVDDASTIKPPKSLKVKQILQYKNNRGPGMARQYGIEHTSNSYIMFIDAGDVFVSKEIQQEIADTIQSNPNNNIFFWLYYYKDKIVTHSDNRLHGKVYKRQFLQDHYITFCKEGSYMNEDIGFNRACRLIGGSSIKYIDKPVIQWIEDKNSLTQKDNNQALYKKQCKALAINSIHCINICYKNHIFTNLVQAEINEIALALYYWFIRVAAERPEFLDNAWAGVKIFYDKYYDKIDPSKIIIGSTRLIQCMKYRTQIHFPINVLRFKRDIHFYTALPPWYRG